MRVRHGTDAILTIGERSYEFELKSVNSARGSVTTVRDFGPDHVRKWLHKHWLIGFYRNGKLQYCKYGSPDAMDPWIREKASYIAPDFALAEKVPSLVTLETMTSIIGSKEIYDIADARKLHKNQYSQAKYREEMDLSNGYSPERMLQIFRARVKYVLERGSTLNNPHIPFGYIDRLPTIDRDHPKSLRALVQRWADSRAE